MCGIAGAVGLLDPSILDAVDKMSAAQRHRGPDDSGMYTTFGSDLSARGIAFAFRRLAIIDTSPAGHQPMIDPHTGCVIIFNGEIYNYQELRSELQRDGLTFQSKCDTEVILKTYARFGIDFVHHLRGMFALAIWDPHRRQTILARDRLGIKPLYTYEAQRSGSQSQALLFASELRAILNCGLVDRKLSHEALQTYIWHGFVAGDQSIIRNVKLFPAATVAAIDADTGKCDHHRYWQLPEASSRSDGVEHLSATLDQAMQQHLQSDVPLGVFLSGGIDSSSIAAIGSKVTSRPLQTFNISFDEAQHDESRFARAVAGAIGSHHHEIRLTQSMFQSQLDDALAGIDQPTFDAVNTYFVSRAVREAGITVALAGTGGDELLGGYRSFRDLPKAVAFCRTLRFMPHSVRKGLAAGVARMFQVSARGNMPRQTRWGKLPDIIRSSGRLFDLYQISYALFTRDMQENLLQRNDSSGAFSGLPSGMESQLRSLIHDQPALHAISMLELSSFITQRLLRDTDAASMAVSLEARVPLLDHEVVEAVAAIESDIRFQPLGRKSLLRKIALRSLDPSLFDRPKRGFELPLNQWCRAGLREELAATLCDAQLCEQCGLNADAVSGLWNSFRSSDCGGGGYWSRVWSLFVLLWWCRVQQVRV